MEETVSMRLPREEIKEIEYISKEEKTTKSTALKDVVRRGIRDKKLELALDKYRKEEATASKAARMAGIPLTKFLDILFEKKISIHYDVDDLREDAESLGL